jgi:hypothetical protein
MMFDPSVGHWVVATFRLLATKRQQRPDRRTEESANQAIEKPEKQVVSGHGWVLPNDIGSVAQCNARRRRRSTRIQVLLLRANDLGFGDMMNLELIERAKAVHLVW